jgi:hypothetical protein
MARFPQGNDFGVGTSNCLRPTYTNSLARVVDQDATNTRIGIGQTNREPCLLQRSTNGSVARHCIGITAASLPGSPGLATPVGWWATEFVL